MFEQIIVLEQNTHLSSIFHALLVKNGQCAVLSKRSLYTFSSFDMTSNATLEIH